MRRALLAALLCASAPLAAAAQDAGARAAETDDAVAPTTGGDASEGDAETSDAETSDAETSDADSSPAEDASGGDAREGAPRGGAATSAEPPTQPTDASGVLGIATVVAAVGALASVWVWVERDDNLGRCATYETEEPRYRACLNVPTIRDQRDVGMGLTLGFAGVALATGVAWAIVAATRGAPPDEAALRCAPGPLSFACAGRF